MVAIYGSENAAGLAYLCLYALQHRGQEGSGIAVANGMIQSQKGMGLVSDIYNEESLSKLKGHIAIGNNKYSTKKDRHVRNLLPLVADLSFGQLAVCLSGALHTEKIRHELVNSGSIFTTTSDSEVLLHLIAKKSSKMRLEDAILETFKEIKGAYTAIFMSSDRLFVLRDPFGIKPLVIGKIGDTYVVVSETAALDLVGATLIREVKAGEMLIISKDGLESYAEIGHEDKMRPCAFEYVYIARPDSLMFGESVYTVRIESGKMLAKQLPVEADMVIPVPDSGIAAAIGYSQESGVPFELGIVRNHYVGRTFIRPTQEIRNFGVKVKLNPVANIIKGKRLVVVDDSIVRGNTCKQIVHMLREAGAKEIHMRIASPPIQYSCHYGIDTPEKDKLIANQYGINGIKDYIGVDSIGYLSLDNLKDVLKHKSHCYACFSGIYPLKMDD